MEPLTPPHAQPLSKTQAEPVRALARELQRVQARLDLLVMSWHELAQTYATALGQEGTYEFRETAQGIVLVRKGD